MTGRGMTSQREQRKILLVEPAFYRLYKDTYSYKDYPLSLGYLAGTIKKETDWDVLVYNADFVPHSEPSMRYSYLSGTGFENYLRNLKDLSAPIWKEIKSTIIEFNPAVIGIHCLTQNFVSASTIAKLAKEINSEIIVMVGGPHPTVIGASILDNPNIDIVVKGEGERTVVELLDAVSKEESLDKVEGIIYRADHQIIETPNRAFIEDLDSLVFPQEYAHEALKDYHKYPISAFRHIFATRGCLYNCFFCGSRYIWSRRVRFRSAANVTDEITSLQRMGIRWIEFDDDTFGVTKEYIRQLCDSLISNCPRIKWGCEIHVNLVDEQIIALMKKAGCCHIRLGIESGNNEMLKRVRKNITIEKAITAADIIRKYGIKLTAFFIIGFPEETEYTLNDTLKAMKKIKGTLTYSIFTPYPGTEAFEFCRENGLIGDSFDIALYNHQSPENCFCLNIDKERFRVLASKIERYVDRHNAKQNIRDVLSIYGLRSLKTAGVYGSLRGLINLIRSVL